MKLHRTGCQNDGIDSNWVPQTFNMDAISMEVTQGGYQKHGIDPKWVW